MPRKSVFDKYVKSALAAGAKDAKIISTDSIVTGRWVRLKCRYGCGGYGQRLTCPPYSPPPEETEKVIREYKTALLVHTDGYVGVKALVVDLERQAFLDGFYKAFAMGAGPCNLCETCDLVEEDCRHPEKARPAMEACGIDVFQTARNNGLPIEVVVDSSCKQNYYGLLLIE